jgi:hypothetical protein
MVDPWKELVSVTGLVLRYTPDKLFPSPEDVSRTGFRNVMCYFQVDDGWCPKHGIISEHRCTFLGYCCHFNRNTKKSGNVYDPYFSPHISVSPALLWGFQVPHTNILKNKIQLDSTYYFIMLMLGSTCFGHFLPTMITRQKTTKTKKKIRT